MTTSTLEWAEGDKAPGTVCAVIASDDRFGTFSAPYAMDLEDEDIEHSFLEFLRQHVQNRQSTEQALTGIGEGHSVSLVDQARSLDASPQSDTTIEHTTRFTKVHEGGKETFVRVHEISSTLGPVRSARRMRSVPPVVDDLSIPPKVPTTDKVPTTPSTAGTTPSTTADKATTPATDNPPTP